MENNINSPFGKLQYIGDLLSTAYPTTVMYCNEENEPIIVEWLDENENGDEHIIYKTSIESLGEFINGIKSHFELIKNSIGKKHYLFYNSIENAKFEKVQFIKLKKNTLPNKSAFFNERFSDDYEVIVNYFDIKFTSKEQKDIYFEVLKGFSKNSESGLLRLHLNESSKVGHGTADTKVLGRILLGYENLYHEVAVDVIRGTDRNAKTNTLPKDVSVLDISSTEVYIQEAASFSIYLKAKSDTNSISEQFESVSDEIFSKVNEAISVATSKRSLETAKSTYSPAVFNSLAEFSEIIIDNKVVLDIDYFNSKSGKSSRNIIKPSEAHIIHNNIISSTTETTQKIELRGYFTNLNTKTGYFVFLTKDQGEFSGYFDSLIRESMVLYNFKSEYDIVLSQVTTNKLNNIAGQIVETLLSCIEVKN